jgi:hypothetical protein
MIEARLLGGAGWGALDINLVLLLSSACRK